MYVIVINPMNVYLCVRLSVNVHSVMVTVVSCVIWGTDKNNINDGI